MGDRPQRNAAWRTVALEHGAGRWETLSTPSSETGRIYKVAGGAPLYLNSCDAGCGNPVMVNQYTIDANGAAPGGPWHLNTVPADGTTLSTPSSETGRI